MPSAEWHNKENYRLAKQNQKYSEIMRWKWNGQRWWEHFSTIYNPEEHNRQEDEDQRLSNAWIVLFVRMDIERRKTIGMLLDANWSNSNFLFEKHVKGVSPQGVPFHWTHYYDETGVEIHPKTRQPI